MTAVFVSMFTLGLVTSLHCVSMCGPMVVSYALKGTEEAPGWRRAVPNLAYQGAKISSYMLVGIVLGAIGSAFSLDAIRPYVMLVAGAFMIVMGLGMTGRVAWAQKLTPRPPRFLMTALTRVRRKASRDADSGQTTLGTPIMFGLLTGLFPCAPLIAAQLSAAATGSALTGGLAMLAFGLGTAPLMLAFGTASSLIPAKVKDRIMVGLAVVVILFGAVYINRGLMRIGSPVTFQSVTAAVLGGEPARAQTPAGDYTTAADGVVEVPLAIQNTQFVPSQVQIPADKPVRLVVDRQEDNACSDQIAIPQLGVLKDLAPFAKTTVDIPASKAGNYTLTCGMGMMSGTLLVGGAAVSSGGSPIVWLVALLAVGGAAVALVMSGKKKSPAPAQKTGSKKSKSAASSAATAGGGVLGLTPQGVILFAAFMVVAVLAGLAFGGMFAN